MHIRHAVLNLCLRLICEIFALAHECRYKQLAAERSQAAADAEAAAAAAAKSAQCSSPPDAADRQKDGSAVPDGVAAETAECVDPDRAPDTGKPASLPVSVVKVCRLLPAAEDSVAMPCFLITQAPTHAVSLRIAIKHFPIHECRG